MNSNVFFAPHPPIIMEPIGGDERMRAKSTIEGMEQVAQKIKEIKPKTIIFVTPHGNSFSNGTCFLGEKKIAGDFRNFGHGDIRYTKAVNMELTHRINDELEAEGFVTVFMDEKLSEAYHVPVQLDHGVMVPMYFIDQYYHDYNIVHITPGHTPLEENFLIGKAMQQVVQAYKKDTGEEVLLLASGDLSHALKDSGPYAFNEAGPKFDKMVKKAVEEKNPIELVNMDYSFVEKAAQCGLRSYLISFGYMDGIDYQSEVFSYEGPFGVGYLTGYLSGGVKSDTGEARAISVMEHIENLEHSRYEKRISQEDEYIKLARKSIESYVKTKLKYKVDSKEFTSGFLDEVMNSQAGVFVSIHKGGKLRGCIGTTSATTDSILDEIIYNGISACSADPRFHEVTEDELEALEISVDILMQTEPIESMAELDVKKYGVIVQQGYKRGLLLPNLDSINSVEEQVSIAKQKAGIVSGKVNLSRFEVIRHEIEG